MIGPPLIFLHIAKTAGTSFRLALANAFGETGVIYDYGKLSEQTSTIVKHHLSVPPYDAYALFEALSALSPRVITGHIGILRYLRLSSVDMVVSFLRNPIKQVFSHWRHHVIHYDYHGSLEDFCKTPHFTNVQAKALANVPIEMIGHLLITERYADSLSLFNSDYDTELELMRANQNTERTGDGYQISDLHRALIIKNNQQDMRLYDQAASLFEQRIEIANNGGDWVYGICHPNDEKGFINGWAYQRNGQPVELELLQNGKVIAETTSVIYRPHLNVFRAPRKSCIGFQFKLKNAVPEDQFICRVKSTGQELFPPLRI
jgi:hypothetical protein